MEPLRDSSLPTSGRGLAFAIHHDSIAPQDHRSIPQTSIVIAKIEDILATILAALSESRVLAIPIRSRRTGAVQLVKFPSSREAEANKFTALLQILHVSHEALVAGTVITKRAIYYQNPELFGSQRYVDQLVDDIAFTFGLGRDALSIVATSKGLIAGAASVTINNGSVLCCNPEDSQGVLLPDIRAITSVHLAGIRWLLVIEKEVNLFASPHPSNCAKGPYNKATFRGLVASRFHETARVGPGILITAKGYPDLSTRKFLHKVETAFPMLPIYGLVDFDPDGIKIMLTYKHGSQSLRHEENATLHRLAWIGPRSSDVFGDDHRRPLSADLNPMSTFDHSLQPFSLSEPGSSPCPSPCQTTGFSPIKVTLPLKAVDRKLAVRLLTVTVGKDSRCTENLDVIRELQIMLLLNTKAEIQAVDEAGDLSVWLDYTLRKELTESEN
ncbi:Spo11/DNA topoisomerase VI subunit A [Nemania sp. FL0916]|nr:Spo11/DNA topoisomerase VI subunit A [Nemania sp. FL0916]